VIATATQRTSRGASVHLLEYVTSEAGTLAVDRKAGVIKNVKILGANSQNGRCYTPEAVRKAAKLYERKAVNVNHPGKSNESRSAYDRLGWLEGVYAKGGELFARKLHVLKTHPLAGPVMEAAERNPALFGLSHNAHGHEQKGSHGTVIESIDTVHSVDLVADAATVNGLFESVQPRARGVVGILRESRGACVPAFRNNAERVRFLRSAGR
jgi:hypothetical protein